MEEWQKVGREEMNTIDKLRELDAKATPGKWVFDAEGDMIWRVHKDAYEDHILDMRGAGFNLPIDDNAELIALMRNNLSKILALVDAAKEFTDACALGCDLPNGINNLREALEALRGKDD